MSNHPCQRSDHRLAAEISVPSSEFPNWTILRIRSETDALPLALLGKPLLSREDQRFCDFLDKVPPVEPGLGLDSGLSRRFAESGVLEIVEVNVQVSVKSARGQIACSDLRSGL